MKRLRLAVKKDGALQFLSHLDFARAVRYVIVRAGVPICYSEGFNPHMKLNFASALGVGVSADVEYLDMELMEEVPVDDVIERMNQKSPHGFAVLKGAYIDEKAPKLMAMANYSTYELSGPVVGNLSNQELQSLLDRFNEADHILYERISPKNKKSRTIDVKNHVIEPITGNVTDGRLRIQVGIFQNDEGAVKPQQVWEVLCTKFSLAAQKDMMLARRIGIFQRREGVCRSLFEIQE
jgi:radical SAM-linked protein